MIFSLTSTVPLHLNSYPAGARPGLLVEAVDALTADEALLLARELPHLRDLIYGELPGLDRDASRKLALGVLNVAQGHPKLLELADGQAAHPEQLTALIEAGDQAWHDQGGLPEGTDLPGLIGKLSPDPETAEQTLRDLIAEARQLAEALPGDSGDGERSAGGEGDSTGRSAE